MSKDFFDFFVSNSSDFGYEIDIKTKKITWYQDINNTLGYTSKNFDSIDSILDITKNKDKEKIKNKLTTTENNQKKSIIFKLKDSKNNYQEFEDIFIKNGEKIIGICKINIKKLNSEIKKSKKRYKKLFEANKIPVLIISTKTGKIVKANNAANRFYGYSDEEFKKLHIWQINQLPKDECFDLLKDSKNEKKECFSLRHKLKDGKEVDVETYTGPVSMKKEELIYSIVFNITKRKQALKKLKLSDTIYNNTKEGIFITDTKSRILSVNKAFENITGYKEKEVVNQKVNILKSNKHSFAFYKKLWTSIRTKGSWEGEITNKTKQNELFPQWLTINAVYDENNKPTNYIAVFTDIRKLKEQEKLIRQKDQIMFQQSKMASMGEMLKNIAHQWRQPLSVITSSASGLKLKKDFGMLSDDDFDEFTNGVLKSSTYLSETIDDFSNYFKNSIKNESFNVKEIIKKAVQLTEPSLRNYDIDLAYKVQENFKIYGIKNELIQVILNLINNSKDAFKENNIEYLQRSIYLEVKRNKKDISICIKDNAGGIDETIIDKIFEPYFTTKHQSQGTGIGLYMSKQIIEEHFNGRLFAQNSYIENKKGVCFYIIIPKELS
ncbi:MAG: PAS domain S-box protein [Campylobacterota bacterium]